MEQSVLFGKRRNGKNGLVSDLHVDSETEVHDCLMYLFLSSIICSL